MNRTRPRTGLRVLVFTLATMPFLLWSLASSAFRPPAASNSTSKDKSASTEATAARPPINLAALMLAPKPPSADLNQVRNGGVGCDATVPNSCDNPADWVNGNAGASNAHYQEGQSIPYRLVMKDLVPGPNTVVIEWDVKHSSANAIDFITHYQRVNESIQPCGPANHPEDVIAGCNPASFTTFDIPAPTGVNSPIPGLPQTVFNALPVAQRRMTMYNGEIDTMTYTNPQGDLSQATASTRITIEFTADSSTVVMAWGGHIARAIDWGAGNSAGGISGSPYHTRLISLNGSGGNQDRSLSAAAVQAPQGCTLTNDNIDVCELPATPIVHALSGTAVAGQTYSFNLVNSGGSLASITSSDTDPSDGTISATVTPSGFGSYTITLTTTNAGGSQQCSATVRVHQKPLANAGNPSYEHCITDGLAFTMSDATSTVPSDGTRTWSVTGGALISDVNALNPTITLTGAGTVTATLTVTGAASCGNASDTSTLTVSPVAVADAGADQTVCASSPAVTLAGSISGSATSASWSGGTGTFSPDANTLGATYTPSAAEITAGSVTLTLTTNDPVGSCDADTDQMTITINPNPSVNITLEDACLGTASLKATVTGGTGPFVYTWKKNNVQVQQSASDTLTLTGPGSYSVSVTDSAVPSCGSNTDTFVVCYTEGAAASNPAQGLSNSLNAAIKPKSEGSILLARLAEFAFTTFAMGIF